MSGPSGIFYGRTATPSAAKGTLPPAGVLAFFIDSVDDHWKYIDSAATVVDITNVGASTFPDVTIADATPQLTFKDTDCTDSDDNATIIATATATGSGAEDIDVAFQAQANGTATDYIAYTAATDALVFGSASNSLVGFYGEDGVNKGAALTTADAVALDATYNVTEQTTVSNMRIRINEIEARLTDLKLIN